MYIIMQHNKKNEPLTLATKKKEKLCKRMKHKTDCSAPQWLVENNCNKTRSKQHEDHTHTQVNQIEENTKCKLKNKEIYNQAKMMKKKVENLNNTKEPTLSRRPAKITAEK